MSTSLLYHGFGIRGYQYVKTAYEAGRVTFTIRQQRGDLRCAACGSRRVVRRGFQSRCFRSLPIGARPVRIELAVPRVGCGDCSEVRQVQVDFADPRRSYTRAFERYVLELSGHMTIRDVAEHLHVGWDLVKDIQKRHLGRKFRRIKLKHLRQIAIDEIAIGRGHRYLTVVLDLLSGAVVFVGEGKGADALKPFWKRLKRSRAKIEAVAMDMSPAYISAVQTHLSKALIVFDHFHVIKLFNDKLADLRRELYREATEQLHKNVLKGTRWLLLKNPENLDNNRDEAKRLHEALTLNQPLATAYYLKEDLRRVWEQPDRAAAQRVLDDWIRRAECSGVRMLTRFAHTLATHRSGILNYYGYRISTGPLEGTNTKIRVLQRKAYGFRDAEFFKLKIYALHETRYALVG
ncbi:ISL3 family transposase [Anaerobaca lacustris]|uniref:ISL3 family transposase n=1 Tax=Anaerobaca lacustris TaxID=3044600 RepID=A0AAW6U836_9BACT|nr:ISL3 family transposase [Sedimentisphaerales bacterium M17dextr]